MKIICTIFCFLFSVSIAFSQDCKSLTSTVDTSIQKAQQLLDYKLKSNNKSDYIEAYIIYPVISRYYTKQKNKDTSIIRKFPDFERVSWCFNGTCFNNNKSIYLSKIEILEKIKNNELQNSYVRETICMLCNKYNLDTNSIKKILDFNDTIQTPENKNANNYALLHKALQLTSLKSNKCINANLYDRYKYQLIDTIYKKFVGSYLDSKNEPETNESNNYDLFSEALLMISILDDQINISEDLYLEILQHQLEDGGWPKSINTTYSNNHTTITALWLLLDFQKKLKLIPN